MDYPATTPPDAEQPAASNTPSSYTQTYPRGRTISLTWFVALMTASVVGGFMLLHDAFRAEDHANSLAMESMFTHAWHVGLYFVIILLYLNALLRRVIVGPVHELYLKLYTVTKGDRDRMRMRSMITEIQDIVDGINLLLSRPEQIAPGSMMNSLFHESRVLREIAEQCDASSDGTRSALLESVARIEALALKDSTEPETEDESQ